MQKEKIVIIALVITVITALSVFVIATNSDIFENLFKEKLVLSEGDCADVNYIGRYALNDTMFDTSYENATNKSGGIPLKIFLSNDMNATSPKPGYTSNMIKGFKDGLIGLQEGQTKIIGPIPPKDAYGTLPKLKVDDTFRTTNITFSLINITFNQTVSVEQLDSENITLKWIDIEMNKNFTLPEGILLEDLNEAVYTPYDALPPYYFWKNSAQIINITNETVLIRCTPTSAQNFSENVSIIGDEDQFIFIFPNATEAIWNETHITFQSSPMKGTKYNMTMQGFSINLTIKEVNTTNITITMEAEGQIINQTVNRTITYNRTHALSRIYRIPLQYADFIITYSVEKAGFSLNPLSNESLTFEVTIEKVYKTSREKS